MGKILPVAVILLFIGLALAPSINASGDKDNLVELDVEFCGLGKKQTVKLTQEEADEVELLFDDIEQRLSEVETREEAEEIFKDAVVELDRYGLLGGLSIRQAQRFIIGKYQKLINFKLIERTNLDDNENRFCFVTGETSNTLFYTPINYLLLRLVEEDIVQLPLAQIVAGIQLISVFIRNCLPFYLSFGNIIGLGYHAPVSRWYPADGSITTYGLNGVITWEGEMRGLLNLSGLGFGGLFTFKPAISGFTGYRIQTKTTSYYFGTAFHVRIGLEE